MKKFAVIGPMSVLLVLLGCASGQQLRVTTTPVGARVTLIRYGVNQVEGSVPGTVSVGGEAGKFEDPPMILGTSPVEYRFKLQEKGKQASFGGLFVRVTRVFTEGLIRAEKDGRVAERRVQFTGDPVKVELVLPAK